MAHLRMEIAGAVELWSLTVVLLHGRGANGRDLLALAPGLPASVRLIAVDAPFRIDEAAYAWYGLTGRFEPEPTSFWESVEAVRDLLTDPLVANPAYPPTVLLGFSQGAVIALTAALWAPERVAGAVAISGYLPSGPEFSRIPEAALSRSFLLVHGTEDPVIPVAMGRDAFHRLEAAGLAVTFSEYAMGHEIRPAALAEVAAWLERLVQR